MRLGLYADIEQADQLPDDQFAFLEENIQTLLVPGDDEETFARRLAIVRKLRKPVYAANRLLPADLPPIGPNVDQPRLAKWLETVMARSERAGVKIIVWGSGASRKLQDGWSRDDARQQFIDLAARTAQVAQQHGVLIVIEPLCRHDSNFIRSLAEGADIVEQVNHPSLRLLADFWHMIHEEEPPSEIVRWKDLLEHVHLSELGMDRGEPGRRGDDLRPYLAALREAGYTKGVVIESFWNDLPKESRSGLQHLREQMRDVNVAA